LIGSNESRDTGVRTVWNAVCIRHRRRGSHRSSKAAGGNHELEATEEKTEMKSGSAGSILREESDSVFVAATRDGKPEAFGFLFARHEARMFRVAFNITRDRENARDVVQQSFEKAFLNLGRFHDKAAFATWLTRIVINESLMWLRKDRVRKEVSFEEHFGGDDEGCFVEIADRRKNPEETYETEEKARIVSGAMQQLSADFRSVLGLQLEEQTLREAARRLRISESALKARLFRARRQLRTLIERGTRSTTQTRRGLAGVRTSRTTS